jgi:hypothetical protein
MSEATDAKKKLHDKLKEAGLELAEQSVRDLVENCFETLKVIVLATENKYDDLVIPLLEVAKPAVLAQVDKIDGKVG